LVDSHLLSVRLLQGLLIVMSPRALSSSVLFLLEALVTIVAAAAAATTAAEARAVLLVPGAKGLAAKHEILVFDDDGLDPSGGVELQLASGGVHGLQVGADVV
jgi:hypothetical protein